MSLAGRAAEEDKFGWCGDEDCGGGKYEAGGAAVGLREGKPLMGRTKVSCAEIFPWLSLRD